MPKVLGIAMHDSSLDDAVDRLIGLCGSGQPRENRLVSATSAHGLVFAKRQPGFRRVLKGFFLNLPDGKPVAWVGRRLKGAPDMRQCRGSDFFRTMIDRSADRPIKHFFCGGKEGVAADLREVCADRYGNRNCVGVYSPPFREMTDDELKALADDINRSGADIVWVGLSTPKQEVFATRLARYTRVHVLATIGAAFDFHVGNVKEAPGIFRRLGLEWCYRLCTEPRRLYGRYAEVVPLFILYNLLDLIGAGADETDDLTDTGEGCSV
jgi:N-acetylglucosaminyldiphosphoundecaprenol N-acetyl-beta-D-mannosaminyltransferase